jgi:hypothetical protein
MILVARFDDGFRQRKESRAIWQSALLRKFVSNFYATMMPFINPSEHLVDIRYADGMEGYDILTRTIGKSSVQFHRGH